MLKTSLAICAIALVIEALIGYPAPLLGRVGHPVVWIGAVVSTFDRTFNEASATPDVRRRNGVFAVAALLTLCSLLGLAIQTLAFAVLPPLLAILAVAALASSGLAQRSLDAHVCAVGKALTDKGLAAGRGAVAKIVGRDTDALDEAGVSRAAIESLAENFADGVVAPALYLALFGLPGVIVYKAINTADSMIGHRTPRHAAFGFAAAKIDDVANWPAARLAAIWIVFAAAILPGASGRDAWRVIRRDARGHASPNAGWPEAAMAGALRVRLGGQRTYAGRIVPDRTIGDDERPPDAGTIARALRVYRLACGLGVVAVVVLATLAASRS